MTKASRLSRSGIEYIVNPDGSRGYTWGIYSGCENRERGICPVPNCWGRIITRRFPKHYPDGFNPHIYPEALLSPLSIKKPATIAVGWVGDLIGYADPDSTAYDKIGLAVRFKDFLYATISTCTRHRFLFLTKNPERLHLWSPFPDNAWVGVIATDAESCLRALRGLEVIKACRKYLSLEPLLNRIGGAWLEEWLKAGILDWVGIGAQSNPTVLPSIEWVREIIKACDRVGIPVWLKNNLKPLIEQAGFAATEWVQCKYPVLRQELPEGIRR